MSDVDQGAPDSEGESEAGEEGRAGDTTEKLGSSGGGGKMLLVGHVVLLLLVALVFWALITAGHGLKAPKQSGGAPRTPARRSRRTRSSGSCCLPGS